MLARLQGKRGPLSDTSTRYVYAVLRIALGRALKQGKVQRNVCTLIDPPARARRELQPLSREQVHVLLDGIRGDRLDALYVAALGTGLRQGELLGMRVTDPGERPDSCTGSGHLTLRWLVGARGFEPPTS